MFGIHYISIIALCITFGIYDVRCFQTLDNAKALLADKLDGYNKDLRPVEDQWSKMVVYVGFEMLSISEVNEVTQTVSINAMFALNWIDASMKWDPSEYGYLFTVFAQNTRFWTPTLVLTTSTEKMKKAGNDFLGIRYNSEGLAYFYPGEIFASSCKLDITYYPFDEHECTLTFTPWGQIPEEIEFYNTSDKVQTSYFTPHGTWEFIDSAIEVVRVPNIAIYYNVKLKLRRLPRYTIINVILPIIFLSMLNLLVFMIPADSGERVSFCITLLLAIAVFLTIISDNLPKTSFPMSILSYYLLAVLVISICMTLATIYSLSLHHRDESETINRVWKRLAYIMRCKCCGRKDMATPERTDTVSRNKVYPISILEDELLGKNKGNSNGKKSLFSKTNQPIETKTIKQTQEINVTWKDVSVAFDRMCFAAFFLTLVIATVVIFCIITGQMGTTTTSTN